jgi:hypothetical protein
MSRARDLGSSINSTVAGKNFIINGGMEIAQRGIGSSSSFITAGSYLLDRWASVLYQSNNFQRVLTSSTFTPSKYALRCGSMSSSQMSGGTSWHHLGQMIDSTVAQPMIGKIVTLSFYMKASQSSYTSNVGGTALTNIQASVYGYNSATPASYDGWSDTTIAQINIPNGQFPTTWTRYTVTGTVPTTINGMSVNFMMVPNFATTNPSDFYYDITGVQLEIGSSATTFSLAGGDYNGEYAKCQSYYQRLISGSGVIGSKNNGTTSYFIVDLKTNMRATPTRTYSSLSDISLSAVNGSTTYPATSFSSNRASVWSASFGIGQGTSDGATGDTAILLMDATNGWIGFSAEL